MSVHAILLLLGACAQVVFAAVQGMFVIFSAASIIDRRSPSELQALLLGNCMWFLPALGLGTAVWMLWLAFRKPTVWAHLWHLLPVGAFAIYVGCAAWLMG